MADLHYSPISGSGILTAGDEVKVIVSYDWVPFLSPTEGMIAGAFDNNPGIASLETVNIYVSETGAELNMRIKSNVKATNADAVKQEVLFMLQNLSDTSSVGIFGLEVTQVLKADGGARGILNKIGTILTGGNTDSADPSTDASGKEKPSTSTFSTSTIIMTGLVALILIAIVVGIIEVKTAI